MTRFEMLQYARLFLQQGFRSTIDADPFSENVMLDQAADRMCEKTDCFWREFTSDLTENEAEYCSPGLYKPKFVYSIDTEGYRYELAILNETAMNNRFGVRYWQNWDANTTAMYAIQQGMRKWRIAPVPSATVPGGLIISGFSKTTDNNIIDGQPFHLWPNPNDECPMPQESHMGVVYWYIAQRCLQMLANDETAVMAARLMPQYENMFNEECGRVEAFAALQWQVKRRGDLRARYYG